MKPTTVDEFVRTKVLPELRPVVAMIRELVKECAPEAQESISYGIPAYKLRRIFAVISPTKKDITLSFSRGAQIKDKYGLLKGVGKSSKHVKIRSLGAANKAALRYYIKQAMKLDAK
jgi:uncharacterized protein YdhG (YjbR/CyaY superfamily)